jgi:hypothetical protein
MRPLLRQLVLRFQVLYFFCRLPPVLLFLSLRIVCPRLVLDKPNSRAPLPLYSAGQKCAEPPTRFQFVRPSVLLPSYPWQRFPSWKPRSKASRRRREKGGGERHACVGLTRQPEAASRAGAIPRSVLRTPQPRFVARGALRRAKRVSTLCESRNCWMKYFVPLRDTPLPRMNVSLKL